MSYNSYFPTYTNPYTSSFSNITTPIVQPQAPIIQPQPQRVQNVNGIEGAKAYPLAGDSSVLLLDSNNPIVWLVQTDSAGYKTCTPYDISPHKEEPMPSTSDYQALADRIAKLEERMNNEPNLRLVSKEQS